MRKERSKSSVCVPGRSDRSRWSAKCRFASATAWVICAAACSDGAGNVALTDPAASPYEAINLGSVALDLNLGNTVTLNPVAYDIAGGAFHRAGSIDVSKSTGASVLVDSVPFGTGYVIVMTASSSAPRVDCTGTATFDVSAPGVTGVSVPIRCREVAPAPPPTTPVPLPPFAPLALSLLLMAAGWLRLQGTSSRRAG